MNRSQRCMTNYSGIYIDDQLSDKKHLDIAAMCQWLEGGGGGETTSRSPGRGLALSGRLVQGYAACVSAPLPARPCTSFAVNC